MVGLEVEQVYQDPPALLLHQDKETTAGTVSMVAPVTKWEAVVVVREHPAETLRPKLAATVVMDYRPQLLVRQ